MVDFSAQDTAFMQRAMAQARAAEAIDEVPVGAVLVAADGEVLAEGHNLTISNSDPSAHAEMQVLREAGRKLGNYRLLDTTLYVTLEPCAMCAMALVHARVKRLVFAASDPKTGACGSVFDLLADGRHNHKVIVAGGLLGEQAGAMLSAYFKAKRLRA
ncbi:MAG TPA: tRNA adenosine(34) deaminase TadA [Arenimonas sp.]|nr:tRNA adenosine(34) deaminase TadA [Arenimonas sp.]